MIVAIILADKSGPASQAYFDTHDADESAIERVAGNVLRGPFGGTLVAAHAEIASKIKERLNGFAVQYADTSKSTSIPGAGLQAASAFRARWEKIMASAAGAFFQGGKQERKKEDGSDWSRHKQSADVKIRGLARSFERDGVMLIPGDSLDVSKELLAAMVEAFARDGQKPAPHACAQAVHNGVRGWPVLLSLDAAAEFLAQAESTTLDAWLLKNLERVIDVKY